MATHRTRPTQLTKQNTNTAVWDDVCMLSNAQCQSSDYTLQAARWTCQPSKGCRSQQETSLSPGFSYCLYAFNCVNGDTVVMLCRLQGGLVSCAKGARADASFLVTRVSHCMYAFNHIDGDHVVMLCHKVDLSVVQRVPEPTRDVLVTRDEGGEREFSGFGAAKNDEYADCFIDADKMPEPTIKASRLLAGSSFLCLHLAGSQNLSRMHGIMLA